MNRQRAKNEHFAVYRANQNQEAEDLKLRLSGRLIWDSSRRGTLDYKAIAAEKIRQAKNIKSRKK